MSVWHPPRLTEGPREASITPQEAKVLKGICHGHENTEIARRLGVSEDTVKTYLRRLLPALGARNRYHAAALACSGQIRIVVRDGRTTPWVEERSSAPTTTVMA